SPIQRAFKLNEYGNVEMFLPEIFIKLSQDFEEAWHDAGQFYWGTAKAWLEKSMIFSNRSRIVELPRTRVQDIDTPEDWHRAELMAQLLLDV
ncbi:pseudaminic acid cytidylyltransferase, partial [Acinetobacter baumannii]